MRPAVSRVQLLCLGMLTYSESGDLRLEGSERSVSQGQPPSLSRVRELRPPRELKQRASGGVSFRAVRTPEGSTLDSAVQCRDCLLARRTLADPTWERACWVGAPRTFCRSCIGVVFILHVGHRSICTCCSKAASSARGVSLRPRASLCPPGESALRSAGVPWICACESTPDEPESRGSLPSTSPLAFRQTCVFPSRR